MFYTGNDIVAVILCPPFFFFFLPKRSADKDLRCLVFWDASDLKAFILNTGHSHRKIH